jgi:hypothetical protein
VAQVVELLTNKYKTQSSNPNTVKNLHRVVFNADLYLGNRKQRSTHLKDLYFYCLNETFFQDNMHHFKQDIRNRHKINKTLFYWANNGAQFCGKGN